jgi:hypothetical protein
VTGGDELFRVQVEPGHDGGPVRIRFFDEDLVRRDDDHRRGPARRPSTGPEDAAAPAFWQSEAAQVALQIAAATGQVTSDDLRRHYTDEPSATGAAIGSLFRKLGKQGRLVLVAHRPSTRPEARGRVVGVWRLP